MTVNEEKALTKRLKTLLCAHLKTLIVQIIVQQL